MSLYQCQHCGCCENTALAMQPGFPPEWFDWTGIEDRRGKHLCSVCMPTKYDGGTVDTRAGKWHGVFPRVFLPMGAFRTNRRGNLEHIETGSEDYRAYAIKAPASPREHLCDRIVCARLGKCAQDDAARWRGCKRAATT